MHLSAIALTVITAHFLALLSPGPDFILIVKSSVRNTTRNALGIPTGIATAHAVYIILCIAGVSSILAKSAGLLFILKLTGGAFLLYLSIKGLKAKKSAYANMNISVSTADAAPSNFLKEFAAGFMTGILNPKNLLFYLSLFTVALHPEVGTTFKVCLGMWMVAVVFLWDATIVFLLSTRTVQQRFTRVSYFIDKCTGIILGCIGLSIIKSALSKS